MTSVRAPPSVLLDTTVMNRLTMKVMRKLVWKPRARSDFTMPGHMGLTMTCGLSLSDISRGN